MAFDLFSQFEEQLPKVEEVPVQPPVEPAAPVKDILAEFEKKSPVYNSPGGMPPVIYEFIAIAKQERIVLTCEYGLHKEIGKKEQEINYEVFHLTRDGRETFFMHAYLIENTIDSSHYYGRAVEWFKKFIKEK